MPRITRYTRLSVSRQWPHLHQFLLRLENRPAHHFGFLQVILSLFCLFFVFKDFSPFFIPFDRTISPLVMNTYTQPLITTILVCLSGSTIVIGIFGFQTRSMIILHLIGFILWTAARDVFSSIPKLICSIPFGLSLAVLWVFESSMMMTLMGKEKNGWLIGWFSSLLASWTVLQLMVEFFGSMDWYLNRGDTVIGVIVVFWLIKGVFWKHPKELVRLDGSRFVEFDRPEKEDEDENEDDDDDEGDDDETVELITLNVTGAPTTTTTASVSTTRKRSKRRRTSAGEQHQEQEHSNSKPVTLSRKIWPRYKNEVYMTVKVLIYGQFSLVGPMLFALGYSHESFLGNQSRYLINKNGWRVPNMRPLLRTSFIHILLTSLVRMTVSVVFGAFVLDNHPATMRLNPILFFGPRINLGDDYYRLVSTRARRGFWMIMMVSVVGVGLMMGTEMVYQSQCDPIDPFLSTYDSSTGWKDNCHAFDIFSSNPLWVLSLLTMMIQGAMESMVFCFSLWILAIMSDGSFSMAARYMSLAGCFILMGFAVGQQVSYTEIGISWCEYTLAKLSFFYSSRLDCWIVGNGRYENWIVGAVWLLGVGSFGVLQRFVMLDELETREVKGEMEVKEGDADLEVK